MLSFSHAFFHSVFILYSFVCLYDLRRFQSTSASVSLPQQLDAPSGTHHHQGIPTTWILLTPSCHQSLLFITVDCIQCLHRANRLDYIVLMECQPLRVIEYQSHPWRTVGVLTHSRGNKRVNAFPKGISLKMSTIAWLEFKFMTKLHSLCYADFSEQSWWRQVFDGQPTLMCPYLKVYWRTSLMTSFLLLQP